MIVFVRHGETSANRAGLLLGRADPELTDRGHAQASALAVAVAAFEPRAVVASPLRRCQQTADAIAASSGLSVVTDSRLVEIDYGEWDGRAWGDVPEADWQRWRDDPSFAPPGGESLRDVTARVVSWCEEQGASERPVVAVSHVSPIKAAVTWALGVDAGVAWRTFVEVASMTRIAVRPHGPVLLSFNERVVPALDAR